MSKTHRGRTASSLHYLWLDLMIPTKFPLFLIHGYDDVDLEEVWKISDKDIPDLLAWLEPLIPQEDK